MHLGSYFLWRHELGLGLGKAYWTMKIIYILSAILGGLSLWKPQEFLTYFEPLSLMGLIGFAIPYLLFSSFIENSKSRLRIFISSDFWVATSTLLLIFESFPIMSSWKPFFAFSLCLLWIGLRYFEAKSWQENLKGHFENPHLLWHQNIGSKGSPLPLMVLVGAIFTIIGLIYKWPNPSNLSLAFAVSCSPVGIWILNKVLKASEKNSWKVLDWKFYKEMRFTRILLSHYQGIFTKPQLKLKSIWTEKVHEWPEAVVKEILYRIAQTNSHPISLCLIENLKKPHKSLVELDEVHYLPHLGVMGRFLDVQGSPCKFSFGSLPWQRILQTTMSDEGRAFLKSSLDANGVVSLLAVNGIIIAAVCFEAEKREDLEIGFSNLVKKFKLSISSSASMKWIPKPLPEQIGFDLFPIERKIAIEEAADRFHQYQIGGHNPALEVLAAWDTTASPDHRSILMDPDPSITAPQHSIIQIYGPHLSNLLAAFRSSGWLTKQWATGYGALGLAALVILWTPQPEYGALLLLLFYFASILWIRRTELQ